MASTSRIRRGTGFTRPRPRAGASLGSAVSGGHVATSGIAGAGVAGAVGKPAAPAPAAGAAPGAPGPVAQPMPWDSQYEAEANNLQTQYNNALAQAEYQRGQGVKQFGFDDASDPYSNLKMLQRSFEQAKKGAMNSMAARGQLYSGSAQNAQNSATYDYNKGYSDQQKKYQDFLRGIEQQKIAAEQEKNSGLVAAQGSRLQAALANRPEPVAAPAPRSARQTAVMTALDNPKLTAKTRARLEAEASRNGWI